MPRAETTLVAVRWLLLLQRRALGRAGFSSCSPRALEHRPGSCGPRTQLFCGMWDSPTPGFVSLSLALAGELFTTEPPGKPLAFFFIPLLRNCSIIGYCGRLMFRYNLFSFIKKFSLPGSSVHGILSGKNTGVGSISFSRESSSPRDQTLVSYLLHCRWILYPLSH